MLFFYPYWCRESERKSKKKLCLYKNCATNIKLLEIWRNGWVYFPGEWYVFASAITHISLVNLRADEFDLVYCQFNDFSNTLKALMWLHWTAQTLIAAFKSSDGFGLKLESSLRTGVLVNKFSRCLCNHFIHIIHSAEALVSPQKGWAQMICFCVSMQSYSTHPWKTTTFDTAFETLMV